MNSSNTGWGLVGDIALGGLKGGLTAAVLALSLYGGGSLIGYGAGLIGSAFALAGGGMIGSGAAVGVAAVAAGVGVMVSGGVIANQLGILFSKSNPGMSSRPPVSWTNVDEGIGAYQTYGSSEKAAEYLMNKKYGQGNWSRGAKTEYNALKKWFDRIIRLWGKR